MGWCADHGLPHSALLAWDETDRSKLVAYLLEKQEHCPDCGTSQREWDEDRYAYEAVVRGCPGCYQREVMRQDNTIAPGARIVLVPKAVAASLREDMVGRG